jgi:hypothetical protein
VPAFGWLGLTFVEAQPTAKSHASATKPTTSRRMAG